MYYKIGQKIRQEEYNFVDKHVGYTEGIITKIEDFFDRHVHCYFEITKYMRNWCGEMKSYENQIGKTSDFYSNALRPPAIME